MTDQKKPRPSIAEIEALVADPDNEVHILPNGDVTVEGRKVDKSAVLATAGRDLPDTY